MDKYEEIKEIEKYALGHNAKIDDVTVHEALVVLIFVWEMLEIQAFMRED